MEMQIATYKSQKVVVWSRHPLKNNNKEMLVNYSYLCLDGSFSFVRIRIISEDNYPNEFRHEGETVKLQWKD